MDSRVILDEKLFRRIPQHVVMQFDGWVYCIEEKGFYYMQTIKGYRDHALKGNRLGQRSSSLNKSWRVIYILRLTNELIINVLEITNHEY